MADEQSTKVVAKINGTPAERAAWITEQKTKAAKQTTTYAAQAKILTPEEMNLGLLELPSLLETEEADRDAVMVYGPPKSGKTMLAGLMSEFYNILWIDGDKGLKTLRVNLPPELLKRIVPIIVPDTTAHPIFMHTFSKIITGRQVKICIEHGAEACPACARNPDAKIAAVALNTLDPKKWIVVADSLSQFTSSCCAFISQKVFGLDHGDTKDDVKFEFDQWGNLKNLIDKAGSYIKDGDYNFIGLSHETLEETEDKTIKQVAAIFGSGRSSLHAGKYFSTMCRAQIVNGKHTYYTSSTYSNKVQVGSRSNVVLEKEETPSLLHVFKPHEAKELLKGSFNEWFFGKRDKPAPKPKELQR